MRAAAFNTAPARSHIKGAPATRIPHSRIPNGRPRQPARKNHAFVIACGIPLAAGPALDYFSREFTSAGAWSNLP